MKRLILMSVIGTSLLLGGCITAASNDAYEARLEAKRETLQQEYNRQIHLEVAIQKMNEEYEKASQPVTGSKEGDVALGVGISAFFYAIRVILFGS